MSIEVSGLSKFYGNQKALDEVSFKIGSGEIVGFLGPNGAGKSTLMKILTTYLKADEGTAVVNGIDVSSDLKKVKKTLGYLPEHNPLYLDLYVKEYLYFNADIYKVSKNRVEEVIEQTGLTPEVNKKIGQLSKGYRQRVGLATALLHEPDVLILDEPTTGLDPNQLVDIRGLIKSIGKDKTVFLSTHIMQEVEAICDRVIIINKGKIVEDRYLNADKAKTDLQILQVEFDREIEKTLLDSLAIIVSAENIGGNLWEISSDSQDDVRPLIFDFAQENGLKLLTVRFKTQDLESLFREKTKTN
ncbi:gliding motility-associated ABC transporter ATP-binding subunit GldA [Avrilella dinanensis]|uniref:Gliding motility-associated ABC transporter ATP-binding subunit GldA n=1 Tax=Avrilella dinanensis TaxID=2008672 RepID=A0A2M9R519_9FLAO|nr:gliding motility-associated ABC transporter ATP-binding subunit GldA [Avrilella dinanensis]PJR03957.1 gliding motility-associated ABC transporter ATP-binding subunit GldA [Avrilella dinanensis]